MTTRATDELERQSVISDEIAIAQRVLDDHTSDPGEGTGA